MGESRRRRKERLEGLESTLLGEVSAQKGKREAGSAVAGDASLAGDKVLARTLEGALRHRGRVERATHGFHTWPAGLHPDAARDLLAVAPGPVLDPFCGGGTVLVEAMLAGREALGLDVGSVACLVARARTRRADEAARTALRVGARAATEKALATVGGPLPDPATVPLEIQRAYEPHVYAELHALRAAIGDDEALRAVFSAILVKVSRRASDTNAELTEAARPPGTTATFFHAKAREYARLLEELDQAAPAGVRARVHRDDAREQRNKGPYGLVLTSPPYPGVYDYVPMQALRRWWLGLDDESALRDEIGSRRNFRADRAEAKEAWRQDTSRWVRAAARSLGEGGRLCVIIGDGNVGGVRLDAWTPLDEAARATGLRFVARATVERWDEGVRVMRPEHVGVWEKPAAG